MEKKRVKERVQLLFSARGGGKSVEEYMLFVLLPFRGGKEHNICAEYQEANGLYLVCG